MTPNERQNAGLSGQISTRSQPMFHRVLRAHPDTVRDTLGAIRQRFRAEVSDDTLGRLELVLAEVMNNVTEHAGAQDGVGDAPRPRPVPSIHLSIVRHEAGLACAITDDGVLLPDECILPRSLPMIDFDDLPEGGFGWYLIQDLTQALCYYREGHRNFLAFSIPFAALGEDD